MLKEIADYLNREIPGCQAEAFEAEVGTSYLKVSPEKILPVAQALKNDPYGFHVLEVISGVDYPEEIAVNYMLANFINKAELMVKVLVPKKGKDEEVEIDSVCSLWKAANFQERECYDMVGVRFRGHPDMRRILCPEDWEGFPLRKDYVVQKVYNGMEVNPAHKINSADHHFFKEMQQKYDAKSISFSWKEEGQEASGEA